MPRPLPNRRPARPAGGRQRAMPLRRAAASVRGYPKGGETRAAIIAAALAEFGALGFTQATTRGIAEAAGVALPAIAYYFGSKQGLYLACAEEIVGRYYQHAAGLAAEAGFALDQAIAPERCRAYLRQILRVLLRVFAQSDEGQSRADFVSREIRDRGPAFEILYQKLWQPGVEIVARLVAGSLGRKQPQDADVADALMLISSLLAFHAGRAVSLRILGWKRLDTAAMAILDAAIDRLVDGIRR